MKCSTSFTQLGKTCMLVVLLLSACNQADDPVPGATLPACKITLSNSSSVTSGTSSSGTFNTATDYTYDSEERLISSATYQGTKIQNGFSYAYNPKGQVSKYTVQFYRYDAESNVTVTTRTYSLEYNEKGQVSGYLYNAASTDPAMPPTTSTSTYEYDSQGNRTKITSQSSSGAISVELHEYQNGNCIKTTFRAGEPTESSVSYDYYLEQENKSRTLSYAGLVGPSTSKNLVKKTTQASTQNPGALIIIDRSYEFNEKGYPVKTTSISGLSTIITTSEYACR